MIYTAESRTRDDPDSKRSKLLTGSHKMGGNYGKTGQGHLTENYMATSLFSSWKETSYLLGVSSQN